MSAEEVKATLPLATAILVYDYILDSPDSAIKDNILNCFEKEPWLTEHRKTKRPLVVPPEMLKPIKIRSPLEKRSQNEYI